MIEERRFYPLRSVSLKARANDQGDGTGDTDLPNITGVGAVFFDPRDAGTEFELYEDVRERIMPGAFDRCLRQRQDVRGLFNHDPNCLLGRTAAGTMNLTVDKRGLVYEIVPGDTGIARDVVEHIRRGDVTGSSFSFSVVKEAFVKGNGDYDIRELHDVDLYDVGPVSFPAYAATTASVSGRAWFLPAPGQPPAFRWTGMTRKQIKKRCRQVKEDLAAKRWTREAIQARGRQLEAELGNKYVRKTEEAPTPPVLRNAPDWS